MIYNNTKSLDRFAAEDICFFDIKPRALQGDILVTFLTLEYVMRTSHGNHNHQHLTLSPRHANQYPAKELTDIDNADYLAMTANAIINATVLLHHLENCSKDAGL